MCRGLKTLVCVYVIRRNQIFGVPCFVVTGAPALGLGLITFCIFLEMPCV